MRRAMSKSAIPARSQKIVAAFNKELREAEEYNLTEQFKRYETQAADRRQAIRANQIPRYAKVQIQRTQEVKPAMLLHGGFSKHQAMDEAGT